MKLKTVNSGRDVMKDFMVFLLSWETFNIAISLQTFHYCHRYFNKRKDRSDFLETLVTNA